ncbi:unnamed protein product [Camellia sinensis]
MAGMLNCKHRSFPKQYLGRPLGAWCGNMATIVMQVQEEEKEEAILVEEEKMPFNGREDYTVKVNVVVLRKMKIIPKGQVYEGNGKWMESNLPTEIEREQVHKRLAQELAYNT